MVAITGSQRLRLLKTQGWNYLPHSPPHNTLKAALNADFRRTPRLVRVSVCGVFLRLCCFITRILSSDPLSCDHGSGMQPKPERASSMRVARKVKLDGKYRACSVGGDYSNFGNSIRHLRREERSEFRGLELHEILAIDAEIGQRRAGIPSRFVSLSDTKVRELMHQAHTSMNALRRHSCELIHSRCRHNAIRAAMRKPPDVIVKPKTKP